MGYVIMGKYTVYTPEWIGIKIMEYYRPLTTGAAASMLQRRGENGRQIIVYTPTFFIYK